MENINSIALFIFMGVFFFGMTWRRAFYFFPGPSENLLVKTLRFLFFAFLISSIIIVYLKFILVIMSSFSLLQVGLFVITTSILVITCFLATKKDLSGKPKHKENNIKIITFWVYLLCGVLLIDILLVTT